MGGNFGVKEAGNAGCERREKRGGKRHLCSLGLRPREIKTIAYIFGNINSTKSWEPLRKGEERGTHTNTKQ